MHLERWIKGRKDGRLGCSWVMLLLSVKQKSRYLDQKEGGMLSLGKEVETLFYVK